MRIVLLSKIPEDSSLLQSWNELVLQMERPEIFYTCEWALSVQAAYHAALKPLLFLGYNGDELVALVCLATDAAGSNVTFLNANTGDYCEFVSRPARRAEFIDAVFAELRKLKTGSLVLANVPADSATSSALQSASRKHGFHAYVRPAYLCAQVNLGSSVQRKEFQTTVSRKRQFRRCMKALEREGPVKLVYRRDWPEIQSSLPNFFDAHLARFRAKQGISFLATPERQFFMQELARRFSATGAMILSILTVADRPLAWSFGFQFHGEWFLYQTTFDIRSEENSPGYCLIARILMEACDIDAMNLVDLGLGAEAYKEWFANSGRQTLYATLTTSPLRHLREVARYRIASEVKRFPKLEAAIRSTRSKLLL